MSESVPVKISRNFMTYADSFGLTDRRTSNDLLAGEPISLEPRPEQSTRSRLLARAWRPFVLLIDFSGNPFMALPCRVRNLSLTFTTFLLCVGLNASRLTAQQTATAPEQSSSQTQTQKSEQSPQPAQLPPKEQPGVKAPGKTPQGEDKRAYGVLPNYRTAEMSESTTPLTSKQKLRIAAKDSFDYPLVLLGAAYAGLYQLENTHPSFGQGMAGYARRLGTSYGDQAIGNLFSEGFMPIVFREDPRYFRLAEGTKTHRTFYALSRIFVTKTDAGNPSFNYSEVVGNGISTGIGLSYYPDARNVSSYMQNWGIALATDASSQVLKEFWPDVKRWWYGRRHKGEPTS